MRNNEYQKFLRTPFWRKLTAKKKRMVGGKCEVCGIRRGLQSHHVRYPDNWFDTELSDLKVLCDGCHKKAHGIYTPRGFWDEDLEIDNFFLAVHLIKVDRLHGRVIGKREKKYVRRMFQRYSTDQRVAYQAIHFFKEL